MKASLAFFVWTVNYLGCDALASPDLLPPYGKQSSQRPVHSVVAWQDRVHRLIDLSKLGYDDKDFRNHPSSVDRGQIFCNYEKIFQIPKRLWYPFCISNTLPEETFERWKNVKRGKDVFIKGMGKFNLQLVYNRVVEHRRRIHKLGVLRPLHERLLGRSIATEIKDISPSVWINSGEHDVVFQDAVIGVVDALIDIAGPNQDVAKQVARNLVEGVVEHDGLNNYTPYWYVSLPELWLAGYFPELYDSERFHCNLENSLAEELVDLERYFHDGRRTPAKIVLDLLRLNEKSLVRQHFVKYVNGWKECPETLEELDLFITPWRAEELGLDDIYDKFQFKQNYLTLPPRRLCKEIRREINRHDQRVFSHLQHVLDVHVESSNMTLKVLRTAGHVRQVGKEMQNCAASYVGEVTNKEALLVALYDGDEKTPMALGECEDYGWSQIEAPRNQDAPDEIKRVYRQHEEYFKDVCQSWM